MPVGVAWAMTVGELLCVAVYLAWGLPRLPGRAAWLLTTSIALAGLAAILLWRAPAISALPLPVLVGGHAVLTWRVRPRRAGTAPARAVAAPDPQPAAAPWPPTLGRYRIEGELGRGATGTVLRARDPDGGRVVALKTLALAQSFHGGELAEVRQRFQREAATAARLRHPDIVKVFDAGEDRGLAYIAMEYLPGHDLRTHAQAPRLLALPVVLRITARVADALAFAHRLGVLHRDVKPANVMVDLEADSVKLTDFGIARLSAGGRTRTGLLLGTPSYLSPEQLAGQRPDGRSDLYALGVMLFQLIAGRLPHEAASMAALMRQIAQQPAPDLRSLGPGVPAELAVLVARLLEKMPGRRPADGGEVAAELRRIAERIEAAAAPRGAPATVPAARFRHRS